MDPFSILILTSGVILFLTFVITSSKSDYIKYAGTTLKGDEKPKLKLDKTKINSFLLIIAGVFAANVIYCLAVVQRFEELLAILIISIFNTVVIGGGLSLWMLFTEETKHNEENNRKNE